MPLTATASSRERCTDVSLPEALAEHSSVQRNRCLSEDQVLAFSEGALSRQQRREVDQHLDSCSLCCDLVIGVAARTSTTRADDSALWSSNLQPDEIIAGRYRIEHFIARGGMGEVYRAHELGPNRTVALKTLLLNHACDTPQRLAGEAGLGLRVAHPNVCRTYEHGVHRLRRRAPLQFMTMELIEGPRLGHVLRRRALELPHTLQLAHQLLSGLAAIHQAGVLHLDFKSDNIVLRDAHGSPEAVIIDFGLSRLAGTSSQAATQPFAGTLAYMAPEHALTQTPSASADVFSFGVVLFEMLTRRLPFEADRRSPAAELVKRMLEAPPRPSDYARDIPPAIDAFVVRCLAGVRRGRFRDGGEALGGLEGTAGR
jgi:eukaryotic-like serine/threonine-protein kinase